MSPAVNGALQCFAVRRGEINNKRWDANFISASLQFDKLSAHPIYPLVPLRDCKILVQYGISAIMSEEQAGTPILRMNNLQDDGWDLTDLKYISLTPKELEKYRLIPGDILFNRTNSKELVGKCEVFKEEGDWVFASYLIRVRLDDSKALPEYVSTFLGTKAGRLQIDRVSRQIIGMSNVNAEELQDLQIPLPLLSVQRKLVSEMENARAVCLVEVAEAEELLNGINDLVLGELEIVEPKEVIRNVYGVRLKRLIHGRQDALYYAPKYEELSKALEYSKYEKVNLGEICPEIVGGATPTKGDTEFYTDSGIKFLRILNIKKNRIDLTDVNYITEVVHNGELKRSQLSENDVLMTITGRVGTAAVVSREILPANINQHIVRMRIKGKNCLPFYLSAYLNTSVGTGLSNRGVTGGTRIALDYEVIRRIQIPLPPLDVQRNIIDGVENIRSKAHELQMDAETKWQQAKANFEAKLIG